MRMQKKLPLHASVDIKAIKYIEDKWREKNRVEPGTSKSSVVNSLILLGIEQDKKHK